MSTGSRNMAEQVLDNKVFKALTTIAVIVGGVLYIENAIKGSIKEVMAPYVEKSVEMKKLVDNHTTDINTLKTKSDLNDYKWNIYENQIKDFMKPEEVRIKRSR